MSRINPSGAHVLRVASEDEINAIKLGRIPSFTDVPEAETTDIRLLRTPPPIEVPKYAGDIQDPSHHPPLVLPFQTDDVRHFAVDVGGSLVKIVYLEPRAYDPDDICSSRPPHTAATRAESQSRSQSRGRGRACRWRLVRGEDGRPKVVCDTGGHLQFVKFESARTDIWAKFIKENHFLGGSRGIVHGTGGGIFKYKKIFEEDLGVKVVKHDEMESLVSGSVFLLNHIRSGDEVFTYEHDRKVFLDAPPSFPFILVSIGSGVSIIRVDSETSFRRIGGSSIGGGTFWGLCKLLTGCESFDEALALTLKGDHTKTDMLVRDIYGSSYTGAGLDSDLIASSFGKVLYTKDSDLCKLTKADMARSLLLAVCYNVAQIAYLTAEKEEGVDQVFFCGYFLRDHPVTLKCISMTLKFWSQEKMRVSF
eukprot:TRINITY_DN1971_c0_g1_i1.p1 TRINITY_DN1971_c0_g1~~TRINITY_DN1971_c0_g1_i1.p1  ORF type:complete len:421 (+),score=64.94 TRINITY_DN1971_c0_g1_i1:204-1466(+)